MDKVHVIRIDNGGAVEPDAIVVKPGDIVVWVPTKTNVKAKLKFKQGQSPFDTDEFPVTPKPGETVSATVKGNATENDYSYTPTGTGQLRQPGIGGGDPIIIVRDNRRVKSKTAKKKKRARKEAP